MRDVKGKLVEVCKRFNRPYKDVDCIGCSFCTTSSRCSYGFHLTRDDVQGVVWRKDKK